MFNKLGIRNNDIMKTTKDLNLNLETFVFIKYKKSK